MTTTADTATVHHLEDHEGAGECQQCGRTGLRWVAILTDSTRVGVECAKKINAAVPAGPTLKPLAGKTVTEAWTDEYGQPCAIYSNGRSAVLAVNMIPLASGAYAFIAEHARTCYGLVVPR